MVLSGTATANLTTSLTMDITSTWGTANAGNTITAQISSADLNN